MAVAEPTPPRPKRVVVVDADDPLTEVVGEFFWREDHDQLVAEQRELAFRDGYEAGWRAAMAQQPMSYRSRSGIGRA